MFSLAAKSQLTCHNSEPQQLCVPYPVSPEMMALMWTLTDAEQDLCASKTTKCTVFTNPNQESSNWKIKNKILRLKMHTVISGNEFSFLTKSFNSETVWLCRHWNTHPWELIKLYSIKNQVFSDHAMNTKQQIQAVHLQWLSSLCSPASWTLLFVVESAIILQMATKTLELKRSCLLFWMLEREGIWKEMNNENIYIWWKKNQPGQQLQSWDPVSP